MSNIVDIELEEQEEDGKGAFDMEEAKPVGIKEVIIKARTIEATIDAKEVIVEAIIRAPKAYSTRVFE